ncbi:tetratricopeptide repeat protein [Alistipes sp. ZOR0009]|uniref:tetratricopeptide repeat protein n=1 Tax=Alistipes sp. ZOR0009 TaxID=1339253 RepID=UPI000645D633|nr:tetratricopeptide repeat protein [Alistipes sp. ZOR0009]
MKALQILVSTLLFFSSTTLFAQREEYNRAIINDDREAIIRFGEQLLSTGQPSKKVYSRLALAYKDKNSYSKSIDYLNRAYLLDSNDVKTSLLLSEVYLAKGEEDKALLSLQKVNELDSNNTQALSLMLKFYLSSRNMQSALFFARRLCAIDSSNASYFRNLGRVYESNNESKNALPAYIKAVQLDSSNIGTVLLLSSAQIANNKYTESIATAQMGLAQLPDKNSRLAILLRRNIANAHYRNEEIDSCLTYIKNLINDGDSTETYCDKLGGFASFKKGFYLDASEYLQRVYNKSVDMDSLMFEIPYYLGKSYYEVNDNKNALRYIAKAIDNLKPDHTKLFMGYIEYGNIFEKTRRFSDAIESFNKAKEYDPESTIPYYSISDIYSNEFKEFPKGINELKSFLRKVDEKRKMGKTISPELESSYSSVKKKVERDNEYFFFEVGTDGKKQAYKTKVNSKGEIIEKKPLSPKKVN